MGLIRKIVFLLLFITYISQIVPVTPLDTTELDQILGGLDLTDVFSPYNTAITQAASALGTGDLNALTTALQTAAQADPIQTLAALQNGGQFSAKNLSAKFNSAQLEQIANNVLNTDMSDILSNNPDIISDYAKLYATTGLNDVNFQNAKKLFYEGIKTADISDITSAWSIIQTEGGNYPYLKMLSDQISTMGSDLNVALSSQFSQSQLENTFETLIPGKPIFNKDARISGLDQKLVSDFSNKNTTDMVNTLNELQGLVPTQTAKLFQNGRPFDYQSLKNTGFVDAQITQIAQAGGLQAADITNYLAGNYTGASDTPVVSNPNGDQPTGPVNTGTGTQAGDNIPGAQEYDTLQAATVESLQALIKSESWTKSDFETLVSMQESRVATLQEAGTASAEEIAEMQNEINISKQVLDDPATEFTPEPVDPVVAA